MQQGLKDGVRIHTWLGTQGMPLIQYWPRGDRSHVRSSASQSIK